MKNFFLLMFCDIFIVSPKNPEVFFIQLSITLLFQFEIFLTNFHIKKIKCYMSMFDFENKFLIYLTK